jgi:hypothetical protein
MPNLTAGNIMFIVVVVSVALVRIVFYITDVVNDAKYYRGYNDGWQAALKKEDKNEK